MVYGMRSLFSICTITLGWEAVDAQVEVLFIKARNDQRSVQYNILNQTKIDNT
jgi:hypothetical protein